MTAHVVTRPTEIWRRRIAREVAEQAAAGSSDPGSQAAHYPPSLLARTDEALAAFEAELATSPAIGDSADGRPADRSPANGNPADASPADRTDAQVFGAVERVVLALNAVNDEQYGSAFETVEREELCDYIHLALVAAGVDVTALAAGRGLEPGEITDAWRDW